MCPAPRRWPGSVRSASPIEDAWRRVAAALEEQSSTAPAARASVMPRGDRPLAEDDPHLGAIERLLAAQPCERLDAAERYRRERPLVALVAPPPERSEPSLRLLRWGPQHLPPSRRPRRSPPPPRPTRDAARGLTRASMLPSAGSRGQSSRCPRSSTAACGSPSHLRPRWGARSGQRAVGRRRPWARRTAGAATSSPGTPSGTAGGRSGSKGHTRGRLRAQHRAGGR
jgi:hypothetical protein